MSRGQASQPPPDRGSRGRRFGPTPSDHTTVTTLSRLGLLGLVALLASLATTPLPAGATPGADAPAHGVAASTSVGLASADEDVGLAWFTDGDDVWVLDIATGDIDAPARYQLPADLRYPDPDGRGMLPYLADVSDDGRWLLYAGPFEVLVLDSHTGDVEVLVEHDWPTDDGPFTEVWHARFRTGAGDEVVVSQMVAPGTFGPDGQPDLADVSIDVLAWQTGGSRTLTPTVSDDQQVSTRFLLSPDGRYLAVAVQEDSRGQPSQEWAPSWPSRTVIMDVDTGAATWVEAASTDPDSIATTSPREWIGDRRLLIEHGVTELVDGTVLATPERLVLDPATGAVTSAPDVVVVDWVPTYGSNMNNLATARSFDGQQLTVVKDSRSLLVEAVRIVGLDGSVQEYPVDGLLAFNDGEARVPFRLSLVAWTPPEAVHAGDGTGVLDASPVHRDAIETALSDGLLLSCAPFRFCPGEPTTRRTMALALATALDLPDPGPDAFAFDDVGEDDPAAGAIRALVGADITVGCEDGTVFCPDDPVRRDQMATFFTRAFDLPTGSPQDFDDVAATNVHASGIAAVAQAGITVGCGDGSSFCPDEAIRRDQMATFLDRRP